MRRPILLAIASVASVAAIAPRAAAQLPGYTLTFAQPDGSGGPSDVFEVVLRLTGAANADPFAFDASATTTDFGLPAGVIPTEGFSTQQGMNVPFASYTGANLYAFFTCSGNFTSSCSPGAYTFAFNNLGDPTRPRIDAYMVANSLVAGMNMDFLHATFTPVGGAAPPGVYVTFNMGMGIRVEGLSASGEAISTSLNLLQTCPTASSLCDFTRTVVGVAAVPEPGTVALLATGLVGLGGMARRRRR